MSIVSCITPTNRADMWFREWSVKTTEYSSSPSGSTLSCGKLTSSLCHIGGRVRLRDVHLPLAGQRQQPPSHDPDRHRIAVDEHIPSSRFGRHRTERAATGEEVQHPVPRLCGGLHHPAYDPLRLLSGVPGFLL